MFYELMSRDREDGRAIGQPSRGTAGFRVVPERYVAGSDTRGRPEGRPYYSRSLRSAQSRKRVPSFAVAVTPRRDETSGLGRTAAEKAAPPSEIF
jgi:hypothetical protein